MKKSIQVSNVEVIPFRPKAGHLGFASCIINDQFYLGDIAIFARPAPEGGIRLGFPVKKLINGTTVDIFKPLNEGVDRQIERAVLERYEALLMQREQTTGGKGNALDRAS